MAMDAASLVLAVSLMGDIALVRNTKLLLFVGLVSSANSPFMVARRTARESPLLSH